MTASVILDKDLSTCHLHEDLVVTVLIVPTDTNTSIVNLWASLKTSAWICFLAVFKVMNSFTDHFLHKYLVSVYW